MRRFLPLLLILFVASGCSALIYEVVWLQLLQLSIGSTAVSMAALLATFMGGMCLGSLALPRLISPRRHPLRVYAWIELGIGICGVLVLCGMPYLDRLYATHAGHGLAGILVRAAICALCLLAPTLLMGASLPAIARWVETTPQGVSWLGYFYGGNIAGAVLGCLLAGFYLLRVHDMAAATWVAAAINAVVTMAGFALAAAMPYRQSERSAEAGATAAWPVLAAIALSGMCALGAEVIWTRVLSLMMGPTVYTFALILAVFLAGLGMGSSAGAYLSRKTLRPRLALGACQLLLAAAVAWAAFLIARGLPYWHISGGSLWARFGFDILRTACAILPAACLWGASFPLALASAARPGQDPGRLVGRVYAGNTIGAIAGAIGFSLLFVPWLGSLHSERVLIALSAVAALLALAPLLRRRRVAALVASASAAVALLAWSVPGVPWVVVAYGRQAQVKVAPGDLLYLTEGMNATIAISESYKTRYFHVSGKVEASSEPQDMRMQRMLGHVPALLHPKPRSVLVVGCGAGVTAGSLVVHPEAERIVICEIEPRIPPAVGRYFARQNHNVLRDPRVEVVYDDARHYIRTTSEKFDIITSDPIHPWVKGAATLYTREYFELCKRHLKPGGVVTQWVPLYESTMETVKSEIATFFEALPHGTIWGNDTILAEGYDVVLLGRPEALAIDIDALERRLARDDHAAVRESLREVGFPSAVALLSSYAGYARDLRPWLAGAQINRDRNLRLQYLAGLGLNAQGAAYIYDDMLRYRRFAREVFAASALREAALRRALGEP